VVWAFQPGQTSIMACPWASELAIAPAFTAPSTPPRTQDERAGKPIPRFKLGATQRVADMTGRMAKTTNNTAAPALGSLGVRGPAKGRRKVFDIQQTEADERFPAGTVGLSVSAYLPRRDPFDSPRCAFARLR